MRTTKQLLGAVSALALVAMSSAPALAAGTSAGDTITNNVSVSFDVGGVAQNAATASDIFTVDARINVTVASNDTGNVTATPGGTQNVLSFDVTNLSNETVDFDLTASYQGGTGTDANIDEENALFFLDGGDGIYNFGQAGSDDVQVTFLDEMAEDETRTVFVVSTVTSSAVDGETFQIALTADAHQAGATGLGAEIEATSGGNNVNAIDFVLADGTGVGGAEVGNNEGDFAAIGTLEVAGAVVTVAKSSRLISDPVNGTTNPKAIPGATVEYCITVANAAGAATATDVDVTDDLPFDVSYEASFGIFVNGDELCTNGAAGGSFSEGTGPSGEDQVLGDLLDVEAGQTRSLYFRVVID
ncbi:hypothetical protein [Erythrobacter sp.]|uniref:hypothetical protein n=1 Tax=Erythrobacter sp. TaxID=1042 RepID=UPI0025FDA104|nr:hypothetical protein [Erythrobacter sp.]